MEGIPLKNSRSQTMLGNTEEADGANANFGDTPNTKWTSERDGAEGGPVSDNNFETLYQSPDDSSRPMSAAEFGPHPYPKGKLFDPILEILEADESLRRASEEQFPIGQVESVLSHKDIEKVMEYDEMTDFKAIVWSLTKGEARNIAEELIADLEKDVEEVLKFRGMHPYDVQDTMDHRYYI